MGVINFSGLSSGLDTKSIVEALSKAEQAPIRALQRKKAVNNSHKTTYGHIETMIKKIKSEAENYTNVEDFYSYTASATNTDSVLTATATGKSITGNYDITVNSLATAQRDYSKSFSAQTDSLSLSGTLTIQVGSDSDDAVDVTLDSDTTLASLASTINSANAGVTAGVMYDGSNYYLQVGGNALGATDGAITYSYSNGLSSSAFDLTTKKTAADASLTIDTYSITSSSNTITDVLPGTSLDLVGTGTSAVTVSADYTKIQENTQKLVDYYNAAMNRINSELAFKGSGNANSLQGDSTLRGLKAKLTAVVGGVVSGLDGVTDYDSLPSVGFKSDKKGLLSIDSTTFQEAIKTDLTGVAMLFVGENSVTGKYDEFEDVVENYTLLGEGSLWVKQDSIDRMNRSIDDQIVRLESRVKAYEERLNRQFLRMEEAMVKIKAQSSYLMQLAAMPGQQSSGGS